jgi:hypothetical protein
MKNLKKLSAAFMLAALFSFSLTSCIDDSVDPVVEAIYANQANLIAAQAAVQNAEAVLLASEAEYNLALAAYELSRAAENNADAAYRLEEVEKLKIANAEAQLVLEENQALLNIELAELINQLNEVNALAALDYALSYRTYMLAANDLLSDKYDAEVALAEAQYEMDFGLTSGFAQTAFENAVIVAKLQVEWEQAEITALQAILDNPSSLPAQVTAWEERLAELQTLSDLKAAEAAAKEAEADQLIDGWDGSDDIREDFIAEYEDQAQKVADLEADIEGFQDQIDDWALALADYATALAAAEQAVIDANANNLAAWTALGGDKDWADLYDEDADGDAIAVGGVKYAAPANLQEVYVNATIDELDAIDALNTYQAAFDLLTATYNAAAVALEAAQAAFDGNTYQADLDTANDDLDDAQSDWDDADDAYTAAEVAFNADSTGSVDTDGTGSDVDDLGELGIHTDLATQTYMQVATWAETTVGSGDYIPASFFPAQYNVTDLEIQKDALIASTDAVGLGIYSIDADADVVIWELDGTSTNGAGTPGTPAASLLDGAGAATLVLTAAQAQAALSLVGFENVESVYFLEVEGDDTSTTNLYTFNVATNMLGLDDFTGRAFDIDAPTYASPNYLVLADDNASYDLTPNTDGENTGDQDVLTAYAVLWNAQLAVLVAQDAFDTGDDALVAAQAAYDEQKDLFDNGVANLTTLTNTKDAAVEAQDDAQEAVEEAWGVLGFDFAAGSAGDDLLEIGDPNADYNDVLTLNAVVTNAEVMLADLEACDADCLQDNIDTAQHEIDLILPVLAVAEGIVADMQAQYDIYMETYIAGGLDADLQAAYDTLMNEVWQLLLEKDIFDAEINYLNDILGAVSTQNLADIRWELEQALESTSWNSVAGAIEDLETAEDALATFMSTEQNAQLWLDYLQAEVDRYQQRYENALALAAEYLALMNAALDS